MIAAVNVHQTFKNYDYKTSFDKSMITKSILKTN